MEKDVRFCLSMLRSRLSFDTKVVKLEQPLILIFVMTNGATPPGGVEGTRVPWNALEYPGRILAIGLTGGRGPINTAYLSAVESELSRS